MDNITEQELRKMVEAIRGMAGNVGKYSQSVDEQTASARRLAKDLDSSKKGFWKDYRDATNRSRHRANAINSRLDSFGDKLKILGKNSDAAVHAFSNLARVIAGGAIVAGLIDYVSDLKSTYSKVNDLGQTFSGGLMDMARTAAQSGVSLDEYVRIVERNNAVLADMGRGGVLGSVMKSFRESARDVGQFGFTLQGINDFVGDYAETLRQQNRLESLNTDQTMRNMKDLAWNTSALSSIMGKSRAEIIKQSQDAQRGALYISKLRSMTGDEADRFSKTMGEVITALASQKGEAGTILAEMFSQTAGTDGNAYMTEAAQSIFNQVLPQGTAMMKELFEKIQQSPDQAMELQNEFVAKLKNEIDKNQKNLNMLALGGNKAAESLIRMSTNLKSYTKLEMAEAKVRAAQQDEATKAIQNFETAWGEFAGRLKVPFYNALTVVLNKLVGFGEKLASPQFSKAIENGVTFLAGMLEKGAINLAAWADSLKAEDVDKAIATALSAVTAIGSLAMSIVSALEILSKAFNELANGEFGENAKTIAKITGVLAAGLIAANIVKQIGTVAVGRMGVKAATLIIEGGSAVGEYLGKASKGASKGKVGGFFKGLSGKTGKMFGGLLTLLAGKELVDGTGDILSKAGSGASKAAEAAKPAGVVAEAVKPSASYIESVTGVAQKAAAEGSDALPKGLGTAGTTLKILGAAGLIIDTIGATKEVMDVLKKKEEGKLTDEEYHKQLTQAIAPRLGGWGGAWALGQLGAMGGGTMGGPWGAIGGGIVGGVAGAFGGSWATEKIIDSLMTGDRTKASDVSSPEIDIMKKRVTELETQLRASADPMGFAQPDWGAIEELKQLKQAIQEQTQIIQNASKTNNRNQREQIRATQNNDNLGGY